MLTIEKFLDADGRVLRWPKKWPERLQVLAYLADKFEYGRSYHEREVNEIPKQWHSFDDWALLRRELSDYGYLQRNKSGTDYRRLVKSSPV